MPTILTIDKKKFRVKRSFEECTPDEIAHVLVSQNFLKLQKISSEKAKIKISIFLKLSNVPQELFLKLSIGQQIYLFNTVRWAFDGRVTKKPFDYFEVGSVKYYLPEPNYSDTSSIELALLNIYYIAFTRKDNAVLDNLYLIAATICRPARSDLNVFQKLANVWNGDKREVYNSVLADERAKHFKENASWGIMIAILQYWESMNSEFLKRFDDCLNGDSGKPLFKNGEGWLAMLEDIAEVGLMGPLEEVYKTNAYNLMMYVEHKAKKIERLEELREKQNKS